MKKKIGLFVIFILTFGFVYIVTGLCISGFKSDLYWSEKDPGKPWGI